jgi:hypothetical protein
MRGPFNPEYLKFLKEDGTIEKVADLIEEIKKATMLGWDGDQFSPVATECICEKLWEIHPGWKVINTRFPVSSDE